MEPTIALVQGDRRSNRFHQWSQPISAVAHEVNQLHELEHAGESEWTPWIALAGLILFFAAAGLLMFGVVEAASQLLK